MSHRGKISLIISFLFCLILCPMVSGCNPAQSVGQAESQAWGPSSVSPVAPTSTPSQEVQPTPTSPPQSVPTIADWYEYTYTEQDYLQTTYTVYMDITDGIIIRAGLHTWNNNAMQEQYCTDIHIYNDLAVYDLNATQVDIAGTFHTRGGEDMYSTQAFTIQRGGFLAHTYVDSEGHLSTFILEPITKDHYDSGIAALHHQAPDCTASDF